MRGFRKSPDRRRRNQGGAVLGLCILALALAACGGSSKTEQPASAGRGASGKDLPLTEAEASFNPSKYSPEPSAVLRSQAVREEIREMERMALVASPETVPGFRVQVLFTQDIDQATRLRDSLSVLVEDEWVYVVYESPYYRVRVGNFPEKVPAGLLIKRLQALGFGDAWIVPDHIIKNPPAKPPEGFIVPDRFREKDLR